MSRSSWQSLVAVACGLVGLLLTGCFRGDENQVGITAAAGAGQVTTVQPVTDWRRKPLSLRLLGRVLQRPVGGASGAAAGRISPAVVTWAARGSYPDGVDDSTDLGALGDQLFGRISPAGQSPVDRVTLNR
jgi:outer membrane lipoprotein SlyB